MAAIPVMMLAGGAIQAISSIEQGNAARQAGDYNAAIYERNADMAIQQSQEDARRQAVVGKMAIGDMRAGYGASGVTSEGSPLEALAASATRAETDRQTILRKGDIEAENYRDQANLSRMGGQNAQTAGYFGAAASMLQAGGRAAAAKWGV